LNVNPMSPVAFYRLLVILNGAVPLLMLGWDAYQGQLGANAVNHALHVTGTLALVFLCLALVITPLRWTTGWGGWVAFRRALGLYAFFYALIHLGIYVGLDRGLSLSSAFHEIWTRRFLQVGAGAVLLMVPLAATSTNGMVRRLGPKRWKLLHRAVYLAAALGVLHYYMLVKSDVRQPLAFAAALVVLLGARFGKHYFELLRIAKNSIKTPSSAHTVVTAPPLATNAAGAMKARQQWKGELKVAAIFQETPEVKTYRLTAADGGPLPFAYLPGQYLNVQLSIDGKRVNRSYTIASSPTRGAACELSIKREPLGLASRFIHDHLNAGDVLKVSGPAGKFIFTGEDASAVLLISGGVGITPMMSIVRYLTDRAWPGDIYFLNVAKTEEGLIFHDEIQWLKRRFSRLSVCQTLTRCAADSMWKGDRGRVTESLLKRFVPDLARQPVYLCGPDEMMDATRSLLLGLGVANSQIKTEKFGAKIGAEATPGTSNEGQKSDRSNGTPSGPEIAFSIKAIDFARSMIRASVSSETSVLEAGEASSIQIPYECRSGICGQCKTRLMEGTVIMDCEDALSPSEKASGLILACQARPLSNLVVDA
jgi:ferredoxin-NADP reductase/DMSO/TMAO reductase YedYZ heme-binding membrane subunit